MMNGTRRGIVLLVLAQAVAGCDDTRSSTPLMPSAPPRPAPQSNMVQVQGWVSDSAFRLLAGATVEVVDGPQAGLTASANADGAFSLTGIFDDTTRFRATKDGHIASTGTLSPNCTTCTSRFIYFYLAVVEPPVIMTGEYTLSFIAASECGEAIPNELRTRTYAATIAPRSDPHSPENTRYNVTVTGSSFLANYGGFPMGVAGSLVAFELRGDGPYLVEQVAPNTYLGFDGRAEASGATSGATTISASFQGFIYYCALSRPMGEYYDCSTGASDTRTQCQSNNHQLILTRR